MSRRKLITIGGFQRMSDKWETVGPLKKPKKPKPPTPVVGQDQYPMTNGSNIVGLTTTTKGGKGPKPKKHSAKTPASFPLTNYDEEETIGKSEILARLLCG